MFSDSSPAKRWNSIVVIAARNEADNIAGVIGKCLRHGRIVVVDNASDDGTAGIAEAAGAIVLRHERDTHIKQSYVDGFRLALLMGADRVVQANAGSSFDHDQIPSLLGGLDSADMVIGSRFVAGSQCTQPRQRRFLSRRGSALVRLATGMPYADLTSGFRAYRAALLQALDDKAILWNLKAHAHAFQFELIYEVHRRGYRIAEVPITYHYASRRTSADLSTVLEALWTICRLALRRLGS